MAREKHISFTLGRELADKKQPRSLFSVKIDLKDIGCTANEVKTAVDEACSGCEVNGLCHPQPPVVVPGRKGARDAKVIHIGVVGQATKHEKCVLNHQGVNLPIKTSS